METKLVSQTLDQVDADVCVLLAFDDLDALGPLAKAADAAAGGWIAETFASGEFKGKLFDLAVLPRPANMRARRLAIIGAGKREAFSSAEMRKIAGAALRALKPKAARRIALLFEEDCATGTLVAAAVEGALLADFEPDRYKTDRKDIPQVDEFTVVLPALTAALEAAFAHGRIIADAQNFSRDLVNEPANRLNPTLLAARARAMAAEAGLDCEVLDRERMTQLGMGSLLGVAQGSAEPPALIVVRYRPPRPAAGAPHLALIGKGVTFDTGGISIKPSEGMEKMKYDMAGGAAVLGAIKALAALKPNIPVTAFVPAVENMPGSRAQRPGDIVTTLNGKTVEVLNTDAEGRLILIDAIEYARRQGCTHLVDAATLTGAIVVALGYVNVGAFTNDQPMLDRVLAAARLEDEKMWPMPLDEDYKDLLKSPFADLPNIGTRWGGAISAAMFLKEFADPTPWVHLDIAGTAWIEDAKPFLAKGPSGVAVRTFVRLALNWL